MCVSGEACSQVVQSQLDGQLIKQMSEFENLGMRLNFLQPARLKEPIMATTNKYQRGCRSSSLGDKMGNSNL